MRQIIILLLCSTVGWAADKKSEKKGKPNHLIKESSPYLLQHAHNPVDWYPWGPEAFAKAKKEGKIVFLSIGYSSCHWCHVMEKESFAHKDVAAIMNKHFVCIKVDREERPDVDHIYMTALQEGLGRRGGWPMSMFLTATGKPVWGGTYWPREDRTIKGQKVGGFKTILKTFAKFQEDRKKDVDAQAEAIADRTITALAGLPGKAVLFEVKKSMLTEAAKAMEEDFDPKYGGQGSPRNDHLGTKFPQPSRLLFLFEHLQRTKAKDLDKVLYLTLDQMALGGIYDQLGGGFHRYSTERTWTVPHFEKMLYDNGQLMEIYSLAYRATNKPLYKRTIEQTLEFIKREMTSPEGGFYSALDADSEGEEGRFYVWTDEDFKKAIPNEKERELFLAVYGDKKIRATIEKLYASAGGPPHFEEKYHILTLNQPMSEYAKSLKMKEAELRKKLAPIMKRLFEIRAKRERPFLDTKILTAWNGLMIAGYARAGEVLKNQEYIKAAEKAADFVLTKLRNKKGRLLRTYSKVPGKKGEAKLNAYLDDYAQLTHGLLNLYEATKNKRWLKESIALTEIMVKHHLDEKRGGFFYTSDDHEKLFARPKLSFDGVRPSGNSAASRNLVRLWILTKEKKYHDLAVKTFQATALALERRPSAVSMMTSAVGLYLDHKGNK